MSRLCGPVLSLVLLVLVCGVRLYGGESYPAGMSGYVEPVSDPLEGFNRGVQTFNGGANRYVAYPVGVAYRWILPKPVRTGVGNFFENLSYPLRLVNNCLQGKFAGAWAETERFCVNTTVGVLGLWDPAEGWGISARDEDFGQTFAHYGMGPGCFLNLPLLGPTTVRDCAGDILGLPFNVVSWLLPKGESLAVNGTGVLNGVFGESASIKQFFDTTYDTYPLTRAGYVLLRECEIRDGEYGVVESSPDEAFGYLLLKPKDESYAERGRVHHVRLSGAKREIAYTCWPYPRHIPLSWKGRSGTIVLLPGLGGHRGSNGVAALAELFNAHGWSVLAFSSTMNPDFFLGLAEARFPGDFVKDSASLDEAITLALSDFGRRYPKICRRESCTILGFSMGGISALYLSLRENGFKCERFVALNPPRYPLRALRLVDSYFDIPLKWDLSRREMSARILFQRVLSGMKHPERGMSLTREESQFLIGVSMRFPLVDAVMASLRENGLHLEGETKELAPELGRTLGISWNTYIERAFLPEYRRREGTNTTIEELGKRFSMDTIGGRLAANPRVFLVHNKNDFLVTAEDLAWYRGVFGERAVILERGSHLGNIYLPEYKELLLKLTSSAAQ